MSEAAIAELTREVKALRAEVAELHDLQAGPKGARRYISGQKAARILGISYPTFKRRYIDTGILFPSRGTKYLKRDVENLL